MNTAAEAEGRTPRRTAEDIEQQTKLALRVREILAAELEAVRGLTHKRRHAEGLAFHEIAMRQLARSSSAGGNVAQKKREKGLETFYRDAPWTYREIQLICNPGLEIKDGARAATIARRELGMPGPCSKRRDRDVIRLALPPRLEAAAARKEVGVEAVVRRKGRKGRKAAAVRRKASAARAGPTDEGGGRMRAAALRRQTTKKQHRAPQSTPHTPVFSRCFLNTTHPEEK